MLLSWYKDLNKILKEEPEYSLAYLCSYQPDIFKLIVKPKDYGGITPQLARFSYNLLRHWKPLQDYKHINVENFIYASAHNQIQSLQTIIDGFKNSDDSFIAVTQKHFFNDGVTNDYSEFRLNTSDILKTLILVAQRTPSLYKEVKKKDVTTAHCYYYEYLWTYAYLVYFHRVFTESKPSMVITANDHNPPNRAMLAVAHFYGINTAYIQHASVSNKFPPLRVNYAFLDGEAALDNYRNCEKNIDNITSNAPKPIVLLSGQKKKVCKSSLVKNTVGIAVNLLDNIQSVLTLVNRLILHNIDVVIRWHPRQSAEDIQRLMRHFDLNSNVRFSDPIKEPVNEFFDYISSLVAGNSSIHLEAALADIDTIYFEFGSVINSDYYGYVKNGISKNCTTIDELIKAILIKNRSFDESKKNAIKYYSATYDSNWEGREGELVVECLRAISLNHELPITKHSL